MQIRFALKPLEKWSSKPRFLPEKELRKFMLKFIYAAFILLGSINNAYSCISIDTIPITISNPGDYCLTKNLLNKDPALSAIIINSDNVSINLQHHVLKASAAVESHSSGIESNGHSNIIIKNGIIKNFMYGVRIQDKDLEKLKNNDSDVMHNVQVLNVVFEFNTFRGVYIQAKNVTVSHSKFRSIGGTTVFPSSFSMAIEVLGNSCDIGQNIIKDIYPVGTGEGVGISVSSFGDGCKIYGNKISNSFRPALGRIFGIWIGPINKVPVIVSENTISNVSYAGNYDKPKIKASANQLSNINCANFFDKERAYYLHKEPCLEEDTNINLARAKKGDPDFLYKLGLQYYEGLWVNKDPNKQYYYFSLAAAKGHVEALRLKNKYGKS